MGMSEMATRSSIGTDPSPKLQPVQQSVETLKNELEETEKVLFELFARLEPIRYMNQVKSENDKDGAGPEKSLCDIADRIDGQSRRVQVMRDRAYEVMRSLQI